MALQPCRNSLRSLRSSSLRRNATVLSRSYASEPNHSVPSLGESLTGLPRWKKTPEAMQAPRVLNFAKDPRNKEWKVNEDPKRLDAMYEALLGPGGSQLLPEEVKWLAVTHKSFDQGRRGFNDRLALLGRMTIVMEATKDIVAAAPMEGTIQEDPYGRTPAHEQLRSIDNLSAVGPIDRAGKEKLYMIAQATGMREVMRWKPRMPRDLEESGIEVVATGAIMAVVGAITLQHGSVVAAKVVRERILSVEP